MTRGSERPAFASRAGSYLAAAATRSRSSSPTICKPWLPDGLAWVWHEFTLRLGDDTWALARGGDPTANVTVLSFREAWARFLTSPRDGRRLPTDDMSLEGPRAELRRFANGFGAGLAA
jgi:hypothetical protein